MCISSSVVGIYRDIMQIRIFPIIFLTLFPRAKIVFITMIVYHVTKPSGNRVNLVVVFFQATHFLGLLRCLLLFSRLCFCLFSCKCLLQLPDNILRTVRSNTSEIYIYSVPPGVLLWWCDHGRST